jgi:hypothetical protein
MLQSASTSQPIPSLLSVGVDMSGTYERGILEGIARHALESNLRQLVDDEAIGHMAAEEMLRRGFLHFAWCGLVDAHSTSTGSFFPSGYAETRQLSSAFRQRFGARPREFRSQRLEKILSSTMDRPA